MTWAQEAEGGGRNAEDSAPAILLESSLLTLDARTWKAAASGDVKVTYQETTLEADEVLLDLEAKEGQAEGSVRLVRGDDLLTCDSLSYRWEEQTGAIRDGELFFGDTGYHIEGGYLEKTGPDTYFLEEGSFTTCRCPSPEDRLPWVLKAKKAEVTLGGYAKVEKAVFHVFRIPLFYLPVGYVPVKVHRESGLLIPRLGQSSRHGWEIFVPVYWAINASMDATIALEGMTKRGVKPSVEFRYRPSRKTEGEWDLTAFQDLKDEEFRYSLNATHNQRLSSSFYDKLDVNVVSDNAYVVDFPGEAGFASDRIVESHGTAGFRKGDFHTTLEATYSDLVADLGGKRVPQRLPHLHMDYIRRPIGFPWLLAGWTSAATHFVTENGDHRARYEVFPEVSTVFSLLRGVSLRNLLGVREILAWQDWDGEASEGTDSRTFWQAGSELEATLGRDYRWGSHRIVHILRPRVQYQWIQEVSGHPFPIVLDGLDGLEKRNWVTYGLYSSFWGSSAEEAGSASSSGLLAEVSVTQSTDLDRDSRISPTQRLVSDLLFSARVRPRPYLSFLLDLQVDPYRGSLRFLETEVGLQDKKDRIRFQVGYLNHRPYSVDPITRVELQDPYVLQHPFEGISRTVRTRLEARILEQWSASLDTLYLVEFSGKIENRFLLKYLSTCKCWSVVFGVNQTMRPDDVSFSVRFQLEGLASRF